MSDLSENDDLLDELIQGRMKRSRLPEMESDSDDELSIDQIKQKMVAAVERSANRNAARPSCDDMDPDYAPTSEEDSNSEKSVSKDKYLGLM